MIETDEMSSPTYEESADLKKRMNACRRHLLSEHKHITQRGEQRRSCDDAQLNEPYKFVLARHVPLGIVQQALESVGLRCVGGVIR